jgi:hypothetical protein
MLAKDIFLAQGKETYPLVCLTAFHDFVKSHSIVHPLGGASGYVKWSNSPYVDYQTLVLEHNFTFASNPPYVQA